MKHFFWVMFLSLVYHVSLGQSKNKKVISGTIRDSASGETLIGASVQLLGSNGPGANGTLTNDYGFYSITLPEGPVSIQISFVGYASKVYSITLNRDTTLNVNLGSNSDLQAVVVNSSASDNQVRSPQMGLVKLNMKELNMVPVLLGEKDVIKTMTLLPGVKSGGEGSAGFYVRGGASDQNLILLDEAPVYNAAHLLVFFSVFNSDAIKDASIYKGGMPAEYGGRLSSVLDIKMNEGNNQRFTVQGGLGLIASRLKIEGPLVKGKGSFMVSGRRTYADVFLKLSSDTTLKKSSLYFYDFNAKANYHFNDKNTIYLSGYLGKDVLGLKDLFGNNWSNTTGTLRFNHLFSNRLFSNTSLIYSKYNYEIQQMTTGNDVKLHTWIEDLNLKQDFQYDYNNRHHFRFGLNIIQHRIAPGDIKSADNSSYNDTHVEKRTGYETAAYLSDNWKANSRLNILYGVRFSDMLVMGPGTFNTYADDGSIVTSQKYGKNEIVKSYFNIEPRLSASYTLNNYSSVKLSYNRNTQSIHLLSNSTGSSPTDVYIMNTNNIKPEIADQVSLGYFRNLHENKYEFSAEIYYKWLQNQLDYKDGAQLLANQNVESQLRFGDGRAYGLELLLKKKYGRLNGWVGYTLSRTEKKIEGINMNNYYPARQDRTHDLSIVGIYKYNKRWSFSAAFTYATGNAVSYPTGKYNVGGKTMYSYSERNGYRQPAAHRLDIGATLEGKPHKRYQTSWTFSIYNVYAHHNPYTITFRDSKTVPNTTEALETSLFPTPIPSVTWNFKF